MLFLLLQNERMRCKYFRNTTYNIFVNIFAAGQNLKATFFAGTLQKFC